MSTNTDPGGNPETSEPEQPARPYRRVGFKAEEFPWFFEDNLETPTEAWECGLNALVSGPIDQPPPDVRVISVPFGKRV